MRAFPWIVVGLCLWQPIRADETEPEPAKSGPEGLIQQYCVACHKTDSGKSGINFVKLEGQADFWQRVLRQLGDGKMPPEGEPLPTPEERNQLIEWSQEKLKAQTPRLRRLNRIEYENTICDLLGIQVDFEELLPPDQLEQGFDNIAASQHTSSFLIERYLEAADRALQIAIPNSPRPLLVKENYDLCEERLVKVTTENVFLKEKGILICFSSSPWVAITVSQFYPRDRGKYRFRVHVRAVQSEGKSIPVRIEAGPMSMGSKNHLIGYFDAPAEETRTIEFIDHLEARSSIRILPFGLMAAHHLHKIGAENYKGPGLAIEGVEVEGPLHEVWPPESHRALFGDLPWQPQEGSREDREVISSDPHHDAKLILQKFLRRAYRRTVTEEDLQPYLDLVIKKLGEGVRFEQAIRVALKAILVSPGFLYIEAGDSDHALASRISYFLWSSMPDQELLDLADQGVLSNPQILHTQVERMLSDQKARRFPKRFVDQWLGLRDINFTEPDRLLYPEFDDVLRDSMVDEAHSFFSEVLNQDLSVLNFVDSDFSMLNERLARHYGIPGVEGLEIRRVALPEESHRGGVMTMAGVLKVTANGTSTSPVIRGAWVLDRILGTPPSPPPPDVPAVEPDVRGAITIREQLAKHRSDPSCASCHTEIDPLGFALESYDVIGGWRTNYRNLQRGEPVVLDGKRMHYLNGLKVDPGDQLADGQAFRDLEELKNILLEEPESLVQAFALRLQTYGTGRIPDSDDRREVEAIVKRLKEKNYGLRSLIHELIGSRIFRK